MKILARLSRSEARGLAGRSRDAPRRKEERGGAGTYNKLTLRVRVREWPGESWGGGNAARSAEPDRRDSRAGIGLRGGKDA